MIKVNERAIEKAIYQRINLEPGCLCWKTPDQRQQVDGTYRKDPMQWRGQPDLISIIRGRVIFIEVKTPKGKLSKHQQTFHERVRGAGGMVYICRSLEDLEEILLYN